MFLLKRKFKVLEKKLRNKQENFTKVEQEKIFVAKENEVLKMKYDYLTFSLSIFSCRQKCLLT